MIQILPVNQSHALFESVKLNGNAWNLNPIIVTGDTKLNTFSHILK